MAPVDTQAPDAPRPPSLLGRLVVAPFRAGLLGAGVFLWACAVLVAVREQRVLFHPSEDTIFLVSIALSITLAVARGYDTPVRSYLALAGRLVGAIAMGVAVLVACAVVFVPMLKSQQAEDRVVLAALGGALLAGLAVAWIRGPRIAGAWRASPRARWILGGSAAALATATAWPLSPRLRCALGSGDGCLYAALGHLETDEALGRWFAERGCSLDSGDCCRIAADRYWGGHDTGRPTPRDRARAAPLYQAACALGDAVGCQEANTLDLHGRCEAQSASACRELAQVYQWRNREAADRFLRQACLLGDAEACQGRR
jgi:hypothetical protein